MASSSERSAESALAAPKRRERNDEERAAPLPPLKWGGGKGGKGGPHQRAKVACLNWAREKRFYTLLGLPHCLKNIWHNKQKLLIARKLLEKRLDRGQKSFFTAYP